MLFINLFVGVCVCVCDVRGITLNTHTQTRSHPQYTYIPEDNNYYHERKNESLVVNKHDKHITYTHTQLHIIRNKKTILFLFDDIHK